jgi:ribonuclease BN (tRNA processing enzyme)
MKITFAGTGSAFTLKNYQTNTVIEQNGKILLIDAGNDIRFSLKELGLSYKDIDALYVTHLHADHVGGVEYLAFTTYFDPSVKEKITLIGNNELIRELWNSTLKGGLKSVQGKKTNLDDYFDTMMIKRNGKFEWEGITFHIVQSVHVVDEYSIVPCYGLMIEDTLGQKIYYTGDTQFCPNQIMDFYKQADLIIHDCETLPFKSGVHANYLDLITLPEDVKKKMMLQHYQDNVLTEIGRWDESAKGAGFTCWNGINFGFVKRGWQLDTRDININVKSS